MDYSTDAILSFRIPLHHADQGGSSPRFVLQLEAS